MGHIDFTLNGVQMELDDARVRAAVRGVQPEPARAHVANVDEVEYPVKQVFSAATGLDRLDFTTNQARSILKRLGFVVSRVSDE